MAWLDKLWFGCGHHCDPRECPIADADEAGRQGGRRESLQGSRLVLPAVIVFIVPLLTAIGGAYLAGHWSAGAPFASQGRWQTAGAVAGLMAGVGLAKAAMSLRHFRRTSSGQGT